jgi:hypothetical protein
MFKVSTASLQTFIDIRFTLTSSVVHTHTHTHTHTPTQTYIYIYTRRLKIPHAAGLVQQFNDFSVRETLTSSHKEHSKNFLAMKIRPETHAKRPNIKRSNCIKALQKR